MHQFKLKNKHIKDNLKSEKDKQEQQQENRPHAFL